MRSPSVRLFPHVILKAAQAPIVTGITLSAMVNSRSDESTEAVVLPLLIKSAAKASRLKFGERLAFPSSTGPDDASGILVSTAIHLPDGSTSIARCLANYPARGSHVVIMLRICFYP
jgi:hypothetical protein